MSKKIDNHLFKAVSRFNLNTNIKNEIAYWGEYNDLPLKYLDTYGDVSKKDTGMSNGSTWHTTAINGVAKLIISDGLALESDGDMPRFVNDLQETPNELLEKIAFDFKILGGFAIEVIWSRGTIAELEELSIAELYHVPMKNVRAQEQDYKGVINGYYISDRWGARRSPAKSPEDAQYIPTFNPNRVVGNEESGSQMKQILVVTTHNPNNDYYPEPDYKSGLIDVFTDSLVRKSKIAMLSNSIVSSAVIQVVTGGMSDNDKKTFLDNLETNHVEALNHGAPMVMEVKDGASFHQIGQPAGNLKNITEGFTTYEPDLQQRILSAHGITFSEIVGVAQENAGLSREQIIEKFNTFMQMTIRPLQMRILSGLNKLSPYIFDDDDSFVINPINLFEGLEDGQAEDITDAEEDTGETITTTTITE